MDKKASIESYRIKRKKRKILKRFIVFLLVIILAGGGLIVYNYADEIGIGTGEEQTGFPISLSGYTAKSLKMCGDNIALLTDKNFVLYSKKGKTLQSVNHGYSNPGLKCSSKRVLIYDISGTKFTVESKTGNIFSKEMENKILFGEIADNGNVAIVTEDSRYQCKVTVFDENAQELYIWYSAEKLVTGLSFTGSGNGCVLSAFNTVDGLVQSEVYQLDFSKDEEVMTISTGENLALSISVKNDGNFHVVTDAGVLSYSSSGSQITSYEFAKSLLRYAEDANGYTVAMLGEDAKSDKTLVVLDSNGGEVGSATIEGSVDSLYTDGNTIYVLTSDEIKTYSMSMSPENNITDQKLSKMIIGKGDVVYTVSSSQIEKYSLTT